MIDGRGGSYWPRVQYADADGVSIAYEVRGDGVIDIAFVPGLIGGLLAAVVDPTLRAQLDRLAAFSRLIRFDRRGLGLSDPLLSGSVPPLEQQVADVLAVLKDVGSRRAVLWGAADGGQVAIMFAAMYPDRVDAVVLSDAWARTYRADDYPFGLRATDAQPLARDVHKHWGDIENPWGVRVFGKQRLREPGFREVFARVQQLSASKAAATAAFLHLDRDVRDVLELVRAPTLVMCAENAPRDQLGHAEYLRQHIPNARMASHAVPSYTADDFALVEEFLTGTSSEPTRDRVLATVVFTDIVGSTEQLERGGDREWRERLDHHDALVRAQLDKFRGREISTAGDGFFATFDGPAVAVECAHAIIDGARTLGITLRAGVHTGECELRGNDLGGIAVHIGARVAALAAPGEVLTTRTVKDLVAGSGIIFTDRGVHDLKGIAQPWHLYAAHT